MDRLDKELKDRKHIVFCVDHYNPLDVIRSLGKVGLNPFVILVEETPVLINHSKYPTKVYVVKTREEGYKILMHDFGNEIKKPFLYCSDDVTMCFLDKHYTELKDRFYFYNASVQGRIEWLQNKDNITDLGIQVGLDVPKKEIVDTGKLPSKLHFPIITKVLASTMGAWKGDVHICYNIKELEAAYAKILSPKLILQEYINKKGEFCMEGFAINDGQDVFIPYVADYIRYYGDSYGHYMNMIPFVDENLKKKILDLFKLTKYNGIFEIEFMKGPNEENYFLEINFRASTWNYAITVGGGNLPYFWAKSTLAGRILIEEMNLLKKPFTAIVEVDDFANNVLYNHNVGFFKWLKQCFTADCHYYFDRQDWKPLFYFILRSIICKLKKNK